MSKQNQTKKTRSRSSAGLRAQVDELQRQLEAEREERYLLINTINNLSNLARPTPAISPTEDTGFPGTEGGDLLGMPAGFRRPAAAMVACSLAENEITRIVVASIMTVDANAFPLTEDTKLGPAEGLGWDKMTKLIPFNLIRKRITEEGCHFSAIPAEFQALDTVGSMIELVKKSTH